MSLMTTAAAILTIVGMAAAVGRRRCSRYLSGTAVVIGAIMLAVLLVPGFSNFEAAAATFALLVPVVAVPLWARVKTRPTLSGWQGSAAGLAIVDTGFMALALFLMPAHQGSQPLAASAAAMSGMSGHMSQMPVGGGVMGAFVLLGWAACAAAVVLPAMRRHGTGFVPHASCSACMILAMAVMAL
ncbi:MAG: hypothetical protein WBX27_07645 [Specibacter sp.]